MSQPESTPTGSGSKTSRFRSPRFWFRMVLLAVLAYLVVVPLAHPLLVKAYAVLPIFLVPILGAPLAYLLFRKNWRRCGFVTVAVTVLLTGAVTAANFTDWYVKSQIANYINPTTVTSMPISVNNRVLPRHTASHYAENANTDNRLHIGRTHIVTDPGSDKMFWQVPLHYNVWYGKIFGSTGAIVRVDAGETGQKAEVIPESGFLFGDESWVTSLLFKWRHPFSSVAEKVYWENADGTWSLLISYKSYRPTISGAMVPVLTGVMEIGQYGGFTNHSVNDAARLFPGAALFPEDLGRLYAESYGTYKHGIDNAWVYKIDMLMLSEDPTLTDEDTGRNRLPNFQEFEGIGLQLVAPMEPSGFTSSALKELLFFDAVTGQARTFAPEHNPPLNGPRQAFKNVHKADNQADWPDFASVEAKLVNIEQPVNGRYWLFTVTRKDDSHAFVMLVLVDGYTLDAMKFDSSADLDNFLNGTTE